MYDNLAFMLLIYTTYVYVRVRTTTRVHKCLPVLCFVFFLIEVLKTLNKEINPHHGGFAVAARDDDDVRAVGLHTCGTRNNQSS